MASQNTAAAAVRLDPGEGKTTAPHPRVFVVMPAYNAGRTLQMTYMELPHDRVDTVILVDDGSSDDTIEIARQLNLKIFMHNRNYGYGANQKTCYAEALEAGAEVVVMVHPDYQYDPRLLPEIIRPLEEGRADVVLGSRLKGGSAWRDGMPWWKYVSNRFLTGVENWVFGLHLSEYHTGYRAYTRAVLERVNFRYNDDKFIFDQEIVAQIVAAGFRITEVAVPTRYFPEASSAGFLASTRYGLGILWLMLRYVLHRRGVWPQRQFESLRSRYSEVR
jgi:glycosyltransferase involved in cell wall biosynthesis